MTHMLRQNIVIILCFEVQQTNKFKENLDILTLILISNLSVLGLNDGPIEVITCTVHTNG